MGWEAAPNREQKGPVSPAEQWGSTCTLRVLWRSRGSEKWGLWSPSETKASRGLKGCPCCLKGFLNSFKADEELACAIPSPGREGVCGREPSARAAQPGPRSSVSRGLGPGHMHFNKPSG